MVKTPSNDHTIGNSLAIHVDEPTENVNWSESRIQFCRRLWELTDRDEVVEPGGADYTAQLMTPMGLNSEGSAADLSSGLGGGTRRTCKNLSCYIDGYEVDTELASLSAGFTKQHGMDRRAPMAVYDPEALALPEERYNALLCRERMYKVSDKPRFLSAMYAGLKPRGHLVMTDFVLSNEASMQDREILAWTTREKGAQPLWTGEQYRKALVGMGMDVRICADETNRYKTMLLQAWARFVAGLSKADLTREFVNDMMREAEYWLMLIRALEAKKLRYVRIHAIKGSVVR